MKTPGRFFKLALAVAVFATSNAHGTYSEEFKMVLSFEGASEFVDHAEDLSRSLPLAKVIAEDRAEEARAIRAGRKAWGAVGWTGHQIGHSAQTLMLLWTLAAVEGIIQEHHLAPLHQKSAEWKDTILRSGDDLINRTGLYGSMIGGSATGVLAGYPLALTAQGIHNVIPNVFTAKLLAGAVGSFVTFVGWEAGSRLWDEAIFNLSINDSGEERTPAEQAQLEKDLKTAQGLRIFELARGHGTDDEKRVFALVMNNVYELLTFTHLERTANWISNTLRLNVMNGEFITIVSTMTVAGTVAGSFAAAPWAGFALGFLGGIAGGIGAHFVPEKNKQRITDTFRNVSLDAATFRLRRNVADLEQTRSSLNFQRHDPRAFTLTQLDELLAKRGRQRESFATTLFTQTYDAATRFQEADLNLNIAVQLLGKETDSTKIKSLEDLRAEFGEIAVKSRGRTEKFLRKLVAFYEAEAVFLENFLGPEDTISSRARAVVDANLSRVRQTAKMLRYLYAGLVPDSAPGLGLTDVTPEVIEGVKAAANIYINQFNLRGFEESLLNEPARGSAK